MTQPTEPGQNPQQPGEFPPAPGAPYAGGPQQYPGGPHPTGMPGNVPQPLSESDERLWGMLSHLGAIFTVFIAPLVIMLAFKDRSRFVKDQATEALNFAITISIGYAALGILNAIVIALAFVTSFFAFLTIITSIGFFALSVVALIWMIMGAVKAYGGQAYRYPFSLRLVK